MIDLPWPGLSACAAPQKRATASEIRITPTLRWSFVISDAKPPSDTARTPTRCSSTFFGSSVGGEPSPEPGVSCAVASVTSSGLCSRFFG